MRKLFLLTITILFIKTGEAQLSSGMLGYFSLDGNFTNSGSASMSASTFNTSFGTNLHGVAGKALQFSGNTGSYTTITDNGNLDFTGDFSICFGVYITTTAINQGFYDNGINYGGEGIWYFASDNTLRFNCRNSSIGAFGALPANQWKVVCAVRSGTTILLYVNGVQVASGTDGTNAISHPNAPVLGQMYYVPTGGNYNPIASGGKMDEIRMYNRALSAAEVAQLSGVVLPVAMGDFSAVKNISGVSLNWETFTETNTAFFEVERSTNMVDFVTIGKLNAKGNTTVRQSYNYIDGSPATWVNYYRLRITDINGSYTYSNAVAVKNNSPVISMSIFPNPVVNILQVQLPSKQNTEATIFISDANGKMVYSQQVQLKEGNNARSVPVVGLPNGVYQFTAVINGDKQTKTFVKQ